MFSHEIRARCERWLNHLRHTPQTRWRRLRSALKFLVIPKYPKCPNSFRLSAVHWLASLSGRVLVTRWVPTKGFRSSPLPFPCFAWRTNFTR